MTTQDASQEGMNKSHSEQDEQLDEVEEESFPASDPHSSWAGSDPDSGQ